MKSKLNTTNNLFRNITSLIEQTKQTLAVTVNSTLTLLYWNIGKQINDEILQNSRADYGKEILQTLSAKLSEEYGKGYTKRNLNNMVRFYKFFGDFEIVHSLSAQLTWTHFKTIIYIDDSLKRDFYIGMIKLDKWSTRTLKDRIDSQLYERTALSKKPDELIEYELKKLYEGEISPNMILKDPYILDFLELNDRYLEKYEKEEDENSPIGIILCADKQSEQIELLQLEESNIHVAQYLTVLPKKELLEAKLHQAIQNAKDKYENRGV